MCRFEDSRIGRLLACVALLGTAARAEFTQQGDKLVGSGYAFSTDPNSGHMNVTQGVSVALSADGNTLAVGGSLDSPGGAVWIFVRSGGVWTQQGDKLTGEGAIGSIVGNGASQGHSVALSADGNTLLVGGREDNFLIGAVWVFTRSDGKWTQQGDKLVGSGAVAGSEQGSGVALSADGNTALIGGSFDGATDIGKGHGAVWVFTRSKGVWTQQGEKLVGTGGSDGSGQGISVSLSADGNTALVGGSLDGSTPSSNGAGAAWVFTRSGGVWTQQGDKLVGAGAVGTAIQGFSVSLSGDGNTALIGGYADNNYVGAAWVFTRSNGVWTQQGDKLIGTGAVGAAKQGFGVALSASGDTALIGGPGDSVTGTSASNGATWAFTRGNGVWTQLGNKLVGTGSSTKKGRQGSAVALSADGTTAAVGGPEEGPDFKQSLGAAWVFAAPPGPPVFLSGASGIPNPAGVGELITFSANAVSGAGALTYTWDFGDATPVGMGASVSHSYGVAGAYTVKVTATDTANVSISSTLAVNIIPVGSGPDSDGDGFSDGFEIDVGTNPKDPASTPTGAPATPTSVLPLAAVKMSIKLNFGKAGNDTISTSGAVQIPAGFKPDGAKAIFVVGGAVRVFALNSKGHGTSGSDSIAFTIKASKGQVAAQMAKYKVSFKKGDFAAKLAGAGLINDDVAAKPLAIAVTLIVSNQVFQRQQSVKYSAKKGKSGGAKG